MDRLAHKKIDRIEQKLDKIVDYMKKWHGVGNDPPWGPWATEKEVNAWRERRRVT